MTTHKECEQMVKDCINRQSKLTEWESDFIESIDNQLDRQAVLEDRQARPGLSEKQINILEKIWDKITEAG